MRVFWSLIAALTFLTVALWFVPTSASSPDALAINDAPAAPPSSSTSRTPDEAARERAAGEAPAQTEDDDVVPLDPEARELLDDLMAGLDARDGNGPPDDAPLDAAGELVATNDSTEDAPREIDGQSDARRVAPAEGGHEPQRSLPDGATLLDERFVVTGAGTADDPYHITWDLLVSAAETYSPRMGMDEIPDRVSKLDGKHVKITGYLAFPLPGQENDEVLVMLNEWDGCCLGVPPSPYDAIEVRLARPMSSQRGQHLIQYGTVEGKMSIDPYVIEDWLLGLYLMDDATVRVDG